MLLFGIVKFLFPKVAHNAYKRQFVVMLNDNNNFYSFDNNSYDPESTI